LVWDISMLGITWANPGAFGILFLIIFVIGILIHNIILKSKRVTLLTGSGYKKNFLKNYSEAKNWIKLILLSISLISLVLAFARPQWNKKEQLVEHFGRDVLIALDISKSMLAQDVKSSRLEVAKRKIKSLVNKLSSERVGLLLFSGTTFVQCPLTADHGAFFMFLDQVDAETISSGTTALDQAIKQALAVFNAIPDRKNKLLIIVTDGEDFSHELAGIKQQARDQQLHIFALGVGTTEGAPIPNIAANGEQDGHIKDKNGAIVISRLNEPVLQEITQQTGGTYVKVQPGNNNDITTIVDQVKKYEQEKLNERKMPQLEDQYHYFIAISFISALIEWLL